jgi:hypothetical protein
MYNGDPVFLETDEYSGQIRLEEVVALPCYPSLIVANAIRASDC